MFKIIIQTSNTFRVFFGDLDALDYIHWSHILRGNKETPVLSRVYEYLDQCDPISCDTLEETNQYNGESYTDENTVLFVFDMTLDELNARAKDIAEEEIKELTAFIADERTSKASRITSSAMLNNMKNVYATVPVLPEGE